jgi:hypothetical protein
MITTTAAIVKGIGKADELVIEARAMSMQWVPLDWKPEGQEFRQAPPRNKWP